MSSFLSRGFDIDRDGNLNTSGFEAHSQKTNIFIKIKMSVQSEYTQISTIIVCSFIKIVSCQAFAGSRWRLGSEGDSQPMNPADIVFMTYCFNYVTFLMLCFAC